MIFFEGVAGRTVAMQDPAVQGSVSLVKISTDPVDFNSQQSVITRVTISNKGNYQFLHTLGVDIYVYVFGDRMGMIGISGLSFATPDCGDGSGGAAGSVQHGMEKMLAWYKKNRISSQPTAMRVVVGSTAIDGFLIGMDQDLADTQSYLVQWQIQLQTPPELSK